MQLILAFSVILGLRITVRIMNTWITHNCTYHECHIYYHCLANSIVVPRRNSDRLKNS